jgi:MoaA/NifB/PqqE/SkfB family radical SAM enzyme
MTTSDKPRFVLDVDIVGTCNLRCPSCPVGNSPELRGRSGLMSRELLVAILDKALEECELTYVGLFNWTEPFLHPRLPEMIRTVRERGLPCALSSNLNVTCDFGEVLRADPTSIRVSLSGFRQETYGRTHRRGNIGRVKENMRALAKAKRETASKVDLYVMFHRYVGNHADEAEMRKLADELGFRFEAVWAYLMPLEKNLALLGEGNTGAVVTEADRELVKTLALPPTTASAIAKRHQERACALQTERLAIDHEGKVQLCCATYDRASYSIADFVRTPLADIQKARRRHSLCASCTKHGLHVVAVYGAEEFEKAAVERVHASFPGLQIEPSLTAPAVMKPPEVETLALKPNEKYMGRLLKRIVNWPKRVAKKLGMGKRAA